jgi:nucleoside-diphosphate-sugar epimerase
MKTNLVIGSEGFIGTPFCRFLEAKGEKVIHFDVKRGPKEDARSAALPLEGVDVVYFLAWDVGGSKYLYEANRQKAQLDWNMDLMKRVFDQLEKSKTRFLFVSSQLSEEVDTVYGVTKRLGEVWTDLLGGACIRVWNAYGFMEEDNIKSHVISDFIYQALTKKKITMMTNGAEWRQFTHITDLSNAFYMAANLPNRRRTVYDASSYEWVRIIDIANMVGAMTGAEVVPGTIMGHDPIASPNRGRVPGWLPTVALEDGISHMVEEARRIISHERRT